MGTAVEPCRDLGQRDLAAILYRTRPHWEEMRNSRLFLTGGTGFFGRWLLRSLIHANDALGLACRVVILTRNPARFRSENAMLTSNEALQVCEGDVSSFEFPDGRFSHVIHAASELSAATSVDPLELMEIARRGSERVLELARRSGAKKFLLTSSGAVYGSPRPGRRAVKEDDSFTGAVSGTGSAYAESKRLAEEICLNFGREHDIEIKVARGFAFVGPYLPKNSRMAAADFIAAAVAGREIVVTGHGHTIRSYLYASDLAVWLWTILFRGASGRPYNVGSNIPVTIAELATAIASASGLDASKVRITGHLKAGEPVDVYVPDIERARLELGLEVFTPLEQAVASTVEFERLNAGATKPPATAILS